jgi:hypothetical protein
MLILKHIRLCVMLKRFQILANGKRTGKEGMRKRTWFFSSYSLRSAKNPSRAVAFANSSRLRNTAMPFPLGKIRESPHPRAYNGCTYCSMSCVLMVRGVPFGGGGGVGSGRIDDKWLFGGVLAPFFFI